MRKALIPEFWVTSEIGDAALRTLMAVAMHADKQGVSYVKNDTLATILKKDVRRIQSDLNQAENLGLIRRKFDDHGKRFFVINRDNRTGDAQRHGMTPSSMTENVTPCRKTSSGDDAQRHRGMTENVTSPNNPYIGNNLLLQSTIQSTHTHSDPEPAISHPQPEPFECVLGNGKKLPPLKLPEQKIPDDLLAIATATNLEGWLGHVQNAGIDINDWRVRKTLIEVRSKSKKINAPGSYAWTIFDALPEQKPEAETFDPQVKNGFRKPTLEEAQKEFDDFIEFAKGSK